MSKVIIVTEKEKCKSIPSKPKKAVFYCIKPIESQEFLFDSFKNEKMFCTHITLAFKPSKEMREYFNNIVGETHTLSVKHILKKEKPVRLLYYQVILPEYITLEIVKCI